MISVRNRVIRVRKVLSACTNKLSHCPSAELGRHPGFTVLPSLANFAAFLGVLCSSSFEMILVKVKPSTARTQRNVAKDAKRGRQSEPWQMLRRVDRASRLAFVVRAGLWSQRFPNNCAPWSDGAHCWCNLRKELVNTRCAPCSLTENLRAIADPDSIFQFYQRDNSEKLRWHDFSADVTYV